MRTVAVVMTEAAVEGGTKPPHCCQNVQQIRRRVQNLQNILVKLYFSYYFIAGLYVVYGYCISDVTLDVATYP